MAPPNLPQILQVISNCRPTCPGCTQECAPKEIVHDRGPKDVNGLGIHTGTGHLVPDHIGARHLGPATLEALQGASADMLAYWTIRVFVREIGLQLNC
jgi:hypothetical protein